MEIDDVGKGKHPKPSDGPVFLQQEESLLITTAEPSYSPKTSTTPTNENLNLPVVTTQVADCISGGNYSKDLGENGLRTEMKDKSSTNGEGMHFEPATAHPVSAASTSSSISDRRVLIKFVSSTSEYQEPSCSGNPNSICETKNASGYSKEDQTESVLKMDVSPSPCDENGGNTVTLDDGGSSRKTDIAIISEHSGNVLVAPDVINTKDAEVTNAEKNSEMGKSDLDCGLQQGSEDGTVFNLRGNKEPCLSSLSNGFSSVSNEDAEQRLEIHLSMKPLGEELGNDPQVSGGVDVTASSSEFLGENRPPSANKSPLLKNEDANIESCQKNLETPQEKDMNTLKSEVLAEHGASPSDCQEVKVINHKSLEGNTHSICKRLSPTCLFPTVKLQTLETHQIPEKLNLPQIAPSKTPQQPVANLEKDDVTKMTVVKDLSQDTTDTSDHNMDKCKLDTVSSAVTNGHSKYLKSCTVIFEKQKPNFVREQEHQDKRGSPPFQPECIGHVRSEMGPPLPRLLTPLSTPPKQGKSINPKQAIGKLSFPSPMDRLSSPTTPIQTHLTPNNHLNSPNLANGVPSSPLQFGSATPEHAVPVPGRLPLTALNSSPSSSSSPSQENSMSMLDNMYPELSAHARTLSILRGNVSLSICSSASGTVPATVVSQMSSFKTVNSTSTAFTKAEVRGEKRQSINLPEPKNSKCLRLDNCSPTVSRKQVPSSSSNSGEDTSPQTPRLDQLTKEPSTPSTEAEDHSEQNLIMNALKKIENQCFDLLPVIQSHLYVGNLPKKPVLRSEETEVISEFCQNNLVSIAVYLAYIH